MGARPDYPEFIAATLPSPLQWEGRTIWRVDLKAYQFSNGQAWLTTTHQDPTTGALVGGGGAIPLGSRGLVVNSRDGSNRPTSLSLAGVTYTVAWAADAVTVTGDDGSLTTAALSAGLLDEVS